MTIYFMPKNVTKISIPIILAITFAIAAVVAVAVPQYRLTIKDFLMNPERKVLAKASADFNGQGLRLSVMKIQQKNQILIEIYPFADLKEENGLFDRIVLPDSVDGYFMFQNNSTNLALADIDGDSILEILVPTYDWQQNPRLNVFKLREDQRGFDRLNQ